MTELAKTAGLIVPKHVADNHRPLQKAETDDLLRELGHRKIIQELSLETAMPDVSALALNPRQAKEVELSEISKMAAQAAQAIVGHGFAFIGEGYQPPSTSKILVLKLLVVKHPLAP